jgi:hypothetical protein
MLARRFGAEEEGGGVPDLRGGEGACDAREAHARGGEREEEVGRVGQIADPPPAGRELWFAPLVAFCPECNLKLANTLTSFIIMIIIKAG